MVREKLGQGMALVLKSWQTLEAPPAADTPLALLPHCTFPCEGKSGYPIPVEDSKFNPCPGGSDGKESACRTGDVGSIPGSGRSPGERNGYPFQYSCLENSMDRGAWWATVHGVTKSQTDTVYTQCVMKRPQACRLQLTFPDPDTRTSPFTSGC